MTNHDHEKGYSMDLPKRKQIRLRNFDYSLNNFYFVTVCTHNKAPLFRTDSFCLTQYGKLAESELLNIPNHFPALSIDKYVIMPNHIHAILVIDATPTTSSPALGTIIGLYKSGVSKQIHGIDPNLNVWQRSYYDHIIRNEHSYQEIWKYIDENPVKWNLDEYY